MYHRAKAMAALKASLACKTPETSKARLALRASNSNSFNFVAPDSLNIGARAQCQAATVLHHYLVTRFETLNALSKFQMLYTLDSRFLRSRARFKSTRCTDLNALNAS